MNRPVMNSKVIEAWIDGGAAKNHKGTLTALDTGELYSYNLKIGHRTKAGVCVLCEYNARTGSFRSQTTSTHVGLAKRLITRSGGLVMHPRVWDTSPLREEVIPF
jgi:hypothetical protein